mmetsp:Transcript_3970/g.11002  ORF Transcript_3970/g.11002 Transcript_3970/m.11002 type:complete len:286 (-) Transcript_3970:11-868(-)
MHCQSVEEDCAMLGGVQGHRFTMRDPGRGSAGFVPPVHETIEQDPDMHVCRVLYSLPESPADHDLNRRLQGRPNHEVIPPRMQHRTGGGRVQTLVGGVHRRDRTPRKMNPGPNVPAHGEDAHSGHDMRKPFNQRFHIGVRADLDQCNMCTVAAVNHLLHGLHPIHVYTAFVLCQRKVSGPAEERTCVVAGVDADTYRDVICANKTEVLGSNMRTSHGVMGGGNHQPDLQLRRPEDLGQREAVVDESPDVGVQDGRHRSRKGAQPQLNAQDRPGHGPECVRHPQSC